MKTIVVSAVNLNVGGTLTILRECLNYLSALAESRDYKIIAIVYDKNLALYPNIEYIEYTWPKKKWVNRLWFEYVSLNKISENIGPVYLWFSLHDTTPNVKADFQAVYCHNPFPFYKWQFKELIFAPKIVLFSLFSKLIYKKGIHKNAYVIVQQKWIKDAFLKLFKLEKNKVVVALPNVLDNDSHLQMQNPSLEEGKSFIYAASPNSHKNFECFCEAVAILEDQGISNFKARITITGKENAYSHWLFKKFGHLNCLIWAGFQNRLSLFDLYAKTDCLVFPSKVETWGLPISEFASFNKYMLLSDLPFAKETAAKSNKVQFFNPESPRDLAKKMLQFINGNLKGFEYVEETKIEAPVVNSWDELFKILLKES